MKWLLKYWPTCLVVTVILYATWLPADIEPDANSFLPDLDKLIHAIMFGGLASAVMFDNERTTAGWLTKKHILYTCLATAIAAAVDETVQGILPIGRPSDWLDFFADSIGIIVAAFAAPPAIRAILHKS